jgi:formyl-CoA transferase/CoA:oxalate CoA-transferase
VEVEGIGEVKLFGLSAQLKKTPGGITSPPPPLGEHTDEVLSGLGYTREQVMALRKEGVV